RTQPGAGPCAAVAAAEAAAVAAVPPHSAAAGAPALKALSVAQGLICCGAALVGVIVAATAPVELTIRELATIAATIGLNRKQAMSHLSWRVRGLGPLLLFQPVDPTTLNTQESFVTVK